MWFFFISYLCYLWLKIDDYNANNLYNSYKTLEGYQSQRISLTERLSQSNISEETKQELTDKIERLDTVINGTNSYISSLKSSVMVQLSTLNNNAINLANHINTVTKTQYITPYPPEDKPDSVGSYFDYDYLLNNEISYLIKDSVTLYKPKTENDSSNNFSEKWETESRYLEVLNPTKIFDASKKLLHQIQIAKDLTTDLVSDKFSISDENIEDNNLEASEVLKNLIENISNNSTTLSTRVKDYENQYNQNYENLKDVAVDLQASVFINIALALEKEDSIDDKTYIFKVAHMTPYKLKNATTDEFFDWMYAKYQVSKQFLNAPYETREKVVAFLLGYTEPEWTAFRTRDKDSAKELVDASAELIEAFGIPTTLTGLAETLAGGPILKAFGKFSKVASKIVSKGASESVFIQKLNNSVVKYKAKLEKYFEKAPPTLKGVVNCYLDNAISIKSFSIKKATIDCEDFPEIQVNIKLWQLRGRKGVKLDEIANLNGTVNDLVNTFNNRKKALSQLLKSEKITDSNDIRKQILDKINDFDKNGIDIKSTGFPDFKKYKIDGWDFDTGGLFKGGAIDWKEADIKLAEYLIEKEIILLKEGQKINKKKIADKFRKDYGLTWHHFEEDLKTLQLVPTAIHDAVRHSGGTSIMDSLNTAKKTDPSIFTRYFEWIKNWF